MLIKSAFQDSYTLQKGSTAHPGCEGLMLASLCHTQAGVPSVIA
jgi:hypothetical protein